MEGRKPAARYLGGFFPTTVAVSHFFSQSPISSALHCLDEWVRGHDGKVCRVPEVLNRQEVLEMIITRESLILILIVGGVTVAAHTVKLVIDLIRGNVD
jgi:hypothetical protein